MDVPDTCLSYEIYYRPHGKIDWSTKTFLSKDVLQVEEVGRRMFKLQNMQHETYYELKMRSVYSDDIKSHYSESQTKQTLKLGKVKFENMFLNQMVVKHDKSIFPDIIRICFFQFSLKK